MNVLLQLTIRLSIIQNTLNVVRTGRNSVGKQGRRWRLGEGGKNLYLFLYIKMIEMVKKTPFFFPF